MYRDLWRLHLSAAIGLPCALGLASQAHRWQAVGWYGLAFACAAILIAPLVIRRQAEKRNPPHGRHSTGKTQF